MIFHDYSTFRSESTGVPKSKNQWGHTFFAIKCDWSIVRSPCLFCWTRMIIKKSSTANKTFQRCSENFLAARKVKRYLHWIFFEAPKWLPQYFKGSSSTNNEESMSSHVLRNVKWMARHTITPFVLLNAHDPKEVSKSKQNVPKTRRKFFNDFQSQRWPSRKAFFWSFDMLTKLLTDVLKGEIVPKSENQCR